MGVGEVIVVGPCLIRGRVNCASCGRFVSGDVCVIEDGGTKFVCNVQCGVNYIAGKETTGGSVD